MDGGPDVFRALAHPARRVIVEFVAACGDEGPPVDSGEIAEQVFLRCDVMWPATSKHLRILRDASRWYCPDRAALAPVLAWAELLGAPAR